MFAEVENEVDKLFEKGIREVVKEVDYVWNILKKEFLNKQKVQYYGNTVNVIDGHIEHIKKNNFKNIWQLLGVIDSVSVVGGDDAQLKKNIKKLRSYLEFLEICEKANGVKENLKRKYIETQQF
ncbi:MAG: hypothetical protein V1698_02655 [bacterium]